MIHIYESAGLTCIQFVFYDNSYSQQKLQREKYFDEKIFSEALWRFDWGFSKRLINLGTNQPGSPIPSLNMRFKLTLDIKIEISNYILVNNTKTARLVIFVSN